MLYRSWCWKVSVVRGGLRALTIGIAAIAILCSASASRKEIYLGSAVRVAGPDSASDDSAIDKEFRYLNMAMDRYYDRLDIYSDADSGGNHYNPSFLYNGPETASIVTDCQRQPHSGKTCIWIHFTGAPGKDGTHSNGIRFQDSATWNGLEPGNNSGTEPDPGKGYDLTGATRLRGWIRCDQPDREVWLYVGCQTDSLATIPVISPKLSAEWQPFEIPLKGLDLSHIASGLSVSYVADEQKEEPCDVYLDDLELDVPRPNTMHLIPSYEPHVSRDDPASRNVCYVYDNALAILAYLARGHQDDLQRARLLADTLVYCHEHNRKIQDGRLYNAYMSGDEPQHPNEAARLPGWWNTEMHMWQEDRFNVSSNTGNIAWAMLALTACHEKTPGDSKYLHAAEALGDWLVKDNHCIDPERPLGFTGGWDGWEDDSAGQASAPHKTGQKKALYKSCEHNIDLVAAFARLYLDTHDPKWRDRAHSARDMVEKLFYPDEGRFVTGTNVPAIDQPGDVLNFIPKPLDVNTWAMLVFGPNEQTKKGLQWVIDKCLVEEEAGDGFRGFAFKFGTAPYIHEADFIPCGCPQKPATDKERDGIWWEGTGQTVCALYMDKQDAQANEFLKQMEEAQQRAPGGNGLGMVAASHDCLITGFELTAVNAKGQEYRIPWVYYRQVHLGASCWHIFAELHFNPYWGIPLSSGIPDWDK